MQPQKIWQRFQTTAAMMDRKIRLPSLRKQRLVSDAKCCYYILKRCFKRKAILIHSWNEPYSFTPPRGSEKTETFASWCFDLFDFFVPDIFLFFWGKDYCQLSIVWRFSHDKSCFFTDPSKFPQAVNGSWLRPCRTLPWPKAAGGNRWKDGGSLVWNSPVFWRICLFNLVAKFWIWIYDGTSGEGRSSVVV